MVVRELQDQDQGQDEAEEAKTEADQGGKEKRQEQQQDKAKTNTVQMISRLVELLNVLRLRHCYYDKTTHTQTQHKQQSVND